MSTISKSIAASREEVFRVLVTPETYPRWLVGAREIRDVEDGWPAVGTRFHHRVGLIGPLTVADNTKVVDIVPPERLSLEVRARPVGRGQSTFTLRSVDGATEVVLEEHPLGILSAVRPLLDPLVRMRNTKSLEQLAHLIEDADADADRGP